MRIDPPIEGLPAPAFLPKKGSLTMAIRTVIPHLIVDGAAQALEFYKNAFGAEIGQSMPTPDGKRLIHATMTLGGQLIYLVDEFPENQAEGGAIDGLSTAMGLDVLVEDGRIQQTNFNSYPVLRIRSAPLVEAHFIQTDVRPSGLGEPAVPPLAAALGNAIFDATGVRVRTMPLKKLGYTI